MTNIQNLQKTKTNIQENTKQDKKLIKKQAKNMNRLFSKEDIYAASKYEIMLIITGHQRNANQNHIEIPTHDGQNGNY